MSTRVDYGLMLLRKAVELKAACEFATRRSRVIKGVPVALEENTMKIYILESYGSGFSTTEVLRGDIASITYPQEVIEKVTKFKVTNELKQRVAEGLKQAQQARGKGRPLEPSQEEPPEQEAKKQ